MLPLTAVLLRGLPIRTRNAGATNNGRELTGEKVVMNTRTISRGHRSAIAVLAAMAIALAAVMVAMTLGAATARADTTGALKGVGSGRCLDDPNSTTTLGTQQQIYDCWGGANQTWTHNSSNELTVTVGGTTLCLDANAKGTTNGTKAIVWSCNGQTNQQWNLNSNGTITSALSGLCLDVSGASTANGALVQLWTCNGQSNQQWTLG